MEGGAWGGGGERERGGVRDGGVRRVLVLEGWRVEYTVNPGMGAVHLTC